VFWFLAWTRYFSLLQIIQTGSGPQPTFYSVGTGDNFPGVKQQGCAVNHSSPSSAKVKSKWSYTFNSPICLHGVDRNKFLAFKPYYKTTQKISELQIASSEYSLYKYFIPHCYSNFRHVCIPVENLLDAVCLYTYNSSRTVEIYSLAFILDNFIKNC
jgi:hypothetical protein